jgi:sec-independent protein translocase protein TatA
MVGLENPLHLVMLLLVVLLIFGAKRLPEMGRSLGSGLRGFKQSLNGDSSEPSHPDETAEPAPALPEAVEWPTATPEPAEAAEEPAGIAEELKTRTAA